MQGLFALCNWRVTGGPYRLQQPVRAGSLESAINDLEQSSPSVDRVEAMSTFGQWLHQHEVLIVLALVLGVGLGLLVRYRSWSVRWWAAWSATAGLGVLATVALRTPPASLSEHNSVDLAQQGVPLEAVFAHDTPDFESVEDIRTLLASAEKPTLVEIYADYGFG
jgi:hypothetical protein